MENNEKLKINKSAAPKALDAFLTGKNFVASSSIEQPWRVSLMLSKEDQELILKGFEALPRKYKAVRDYFREGMLEIAKRDIEKGHKIQDVLENK